MKQVEKLVVFAAGLAVLVSLTAAKILPLTAAAILVVFLLIFILPRSFVKEWKVLVWVFFIIISIILIAPSMSAKGVIINSVDKNVSSSLETGEIIYYINGAEATRENVQLQYNGILNVVTSKGTKYITANGSLGINVDYAQPTNIKFGLDIKGGVRGILQPNTTDNNTIEQIINTLQTRINIYGLREASFRATSDPISNAKFIEISIAGGTKDELKNLIESHGNF